MRLEPETLAWAGETASTEWEDAMVARYKARRVAKPQRWLLLRRVIASRLLWIPALVLFLGLCWAIGRMTPG